MMATSRGTDWYQTPNGRAGVSGSQTVGDKVHGQKGNSPDHQIRSQNLRQVEKDVETRKQLGG